MPIYTYNCDLCGTFEEVAPMTRFSDPCDCPTCGASAPRALTMPQLSSVSSFARQSHAINEQSAHNPKRAKENGLKPSGPRINSRTVRGADGSKSTPSTRPWMMSH